jgi:2-haloalkanoic acid dehalogenase type II
MTADRPFDVVFLDFFGTVASGDADAVDAACQRVIDDRRLDLTHDAVSRAWAEAFFALMDISNGRDFKLLRDCQQISLEAAMEKLGYPLNGKTYSDHLRRYQRRPPIFEDVKPALGNLDVPVCLVSNADEDDLQEALAAHSLQFDAVISSEATRSYKPHAVIFEVALERMGVAPDRCLHVGDSLHSDIGGAQALGIRTAWIQRDRRIGDIGSAAPDFTVRQLTELPALVATSLPPER